MLDDIVLQCEQVLAVLLLSPLLHGFMVTMEERVQRGQGPSIFQPYRDLWKLFHKTLLIPESASWVFFWAPVVAFTAMLIVPMLIPVLTNFPLPLSDMGDILGGGLILTLGGFFILLAFSIVDIRNVNISCAIGIRNIVDRCFCVFYL